MNPGDTYDALGEDVTVQRILEAAQAMPPEFREHLDTALVDYRPTDVLPRDVFVDIVNGFTPEPTGRKVSQMTSLFEELNDDGLVRFGAIKNIFGPDAELVVGNIADTFTLQEFIEHFGDLFDEYGQIQELPPFIIEQLRNVNHRLTALKDEVDHNADERVGVEMRLVDERRRFASEKNDLLDAAAEVEEQRDSLYDELKAVKRQMRDLKRKEAEQVEADPEPAAAAAPPLPTRYASTHSFEHSDDGSSTTYADIAVNGEADPPPDPVFNAPPPPPPAPDPEPAPAVAAWASAKVPLDTFAWYKKSMSRTEAEQFLENKELGAFVVRDSRIQGSYSISIRAKHKVLHYNIAQVENNKVALRYLGEDGEEELVQPVLDWIPDLVEHFRRVPVNASTPTLVDIFVLAETGV